MKVRHVDWYADEWIAGTIDLSLAERGLYITACSLIYSRGGAVLVGILRSFCRDDLRSYKRCLQKLVDLGKLDLKEGYLSSNRCVTELERANKRQLSAEQNGAKGGRPFSDNNSLAKPGGSVNAKPNYQLPTTNQEEKKDNTREARRSAGAALIDLDFEVFWRECPKKVGKGIALKAWKKARDGGVPTETLLAGIKRFAALKAGTEPQFIAHPATWLNQQRWLDEDPRDIARQPSRPTGPPPIIEDGHGNRINPLDGSIVSEPGALSIDTEETTGQRICSIH